MSFKKITEPDLAGLGVIGLPDAPGLSAAEMQAKMEEVIKNAVIPAFNRLIDELGAETAAGLGAAIGVFTALSVQIIYTISNKLLKSDDLEF